VSLAAPTADATPADEAPDHDRAAVVSLTTGATRGSVARALRTGCSTFRARKRLACPSHCIRSNRMFLFL
jgi:hypothetical protein